MTSTPHYLSTGHKRKKKQINVSHSKKPRSNLLLARLFRLGNSSPNDTGELFVSNVVEHSDGQGDSSKHKQSEASKEPERDANVFLGARRPRPMGKRSVFFGPSAKAVACKADRGAAAGTGICRCVLVQALSLMRAIAGLGDAAVQGVEAGGNSSCGGSEGVLRRGSWFRRGRGLMKVGNHPLRLALVKCLGLARQFTNASEEQESCLHFANLTKRGQPWEAVDHVVQSFGVL